MGKKIKGIVELETCEWGIEINDVKIKDIQLPENMRRMMVNQAEAGKLIDQSPSAIKLRLYQTLSNIAAEKN